MDLPYLSVPINVSAYLANLNRAIEVVSEIPLRVPLDAVHIHNGYDEDAASHISIMGQPADYDLFFTPVFNYTRAPDEAFEQKYDFVIFPDAREGGTPERSIKSLPVGLWNNILEQFPSRSSIAVIRGVDHTAYCNVVVDVAKAHGHVITPVSGSLRYVMSTVLQGGTFIGMDSGTTHIAANMIAAAQLRGRKIQFREVFNNFYVRVDKYGIAHPTIPYFTYLTHNRESRINPARRSGQLDHLDPATLARFFTASDQELLQEINQ